MQRLDVVRSERRLEHAFIAHWNRHYGRTRSVEWVVLLSQLFFWGLIHVAFVLQG